MRLCYGWDGLWWLAPPVHQELFDEGIAVKVSNHLLGRPCPQLVKTGGIRSPGNNASIYLEYTDAAAAISKSCEVNAVGEGFDNMNRR